MTFDTTTGSSNVNFGSALSSSGLTACAAAPIVTVKSTATSDADGDRPTAINFKGGGDEVLGQVKVSHDGAADDNKGQLRIYTNDGSDAANPDLAIEINSSQVTCFLGNVEVGSGSGAAAKDLKVWGDLTVEGATTTINTAELTVEDALITIASGNSTVAGADGAGISIPDGSTGISWVYENTGASWCSSENIDMVTGKDYKIANTSVLNATTLGSAVVNSSLTTVGILNSGSITSGFGNIDNGASNITSAGIWSICDDYAGAGAVGSLNFGGGGGANDANMGYDGNNFKFNVVAGSLDISASNAIDFTAPDMTLLDANNDGNPTFTMGSTSTNALIVTSNYEAGTQILSSVTYATPSASGTVDAGKHVFSVDGTTLLEIRDSCLHAANGTEAYELNNFKIDGGTYS